MREWLKEVVKAGTSWDAFKTLMRPDKDTLEVLEFARLFSGEPKTISEILRVKYYDFYNEQRKNLKKISQLNVDCWKSPQKYAESIQHSGGMSLMKRLGLNQENRNGSKDFLFAFCTNWQLVLLRQYSSLLCLDSTHNTCCTLKSSHSAFLHPIVI